MRRRLSIGVLAGAWMLLALPAAAAAQADRTTPVVGGGSFNTAPLLRPGTYSDTILPAEGTYYRVEMQNGQRLKVTATFDTSGFETDSTRPGFVPGISNLLYDVKLYTPLRQPVLFDRSRTAGDPGSATRVSVRSALALGYEQILDGTYTDEEFAGPGTYYIRLASNDLLDSFKNPVEIPTEISVRVTGTPAPSSRDFTPRLLPEGGGDGDGGGSTPRTDLSLGSLRLTSETAGDADPSLGAALAVALYALLGGLVLGAVAGAALRRRI